MTFLAKGFDAGKRSEATSIIKEFQEKIKAADEPAGNRDWQAFADSRGKISTLLSNYLALFQDVPDEI